MVARTLLDTLRQVTEDAEDVAAILAIINRLAQDIGKNFRHINCSRFVVLYVAGLYIKDVPGEGSVGDINIHDVSHLGPSCRP